MPQAKVHILHTGFLSPLQCQTGQYTVIFRPHCRVRITWGAGCHWPRSDDAYVEPGVQWPPELAQCVLGHLDSLAQPVSVDLVVHVGGEQGRADVTEQITTTYKIV
jgi:hypothetical protein